MQIKVYHMECSSSSNHSLLVDHDEYSLRQYLMEFLQHDNHMPMETTL